jgi:2-polyprenyl-6-methoxyphenol hydroxylase-like FAD-dependent oxidoreductase
MVEEVPVVIVGGGPIGLTLSCILGKNNIEHVLLEKNDSTSNWPKAMLTNPRSMELYHQLGMVCKTAWFFLIITIVIY